MHHSHTVTLGTGPCLLSMHLLELPPETSWSGVWDCNKGLSPCIPCLSLLCTFLSCSNLPDCAPFHWPWEVCCSCLSGTSRLPTTSVLCAPCCVSYYVFPDPHQDVILFLAGPLVELAVLVGIHSNTSHVFGLLKKIQVQ